MSNFDQIYIKMLRDKLQQLNDGELDIDEIIDYKSWKRATSVLGHCIAHLHMIDMNKEEKKDLFHKLIIALLKSGASTATTIKHYRSYKEEQPILFHALLDRSTYIRDEVLQILIEKSSLEVINKKQTRHNTTASLVGHLVKDRKQDFIPVLLRKGARVDNIILFDACQSEYIETETLQMLITKAGNCINEPIKDQQGNTLLHWAIKNNKKSLAIWLLRLHKQGIIDISGSLTLQNDHQETAQQLINNDDDLKQLNNKQSSSKFLDQQSMVLLECFRQELEKEEKKYHTQLLKWLRESKDLEKLNEPRKLQSEEEEFSANTLELATCLCISAAQNSHNLHVTTWLDIISQLINNGAGLSSNSNEEENSFPYLSALISVLSEPVSKKLIESSENPIQSINSVKFPGEEELCIPSPIVPIIFFEEEIEKKAEMIRLLVDKGLDINSAVPKLGGTLLHFFIEKEEETEDKEKFVGWLLELHEDKIIDLTESLLYSNSKHDIKTPLEMANKTSSFYKKLKELTKRAQATLK